MKTMIELKGKVTNSRIYFCAPKSACRDGRFDFDKIESLGYERFAYLDGSHGIINNTINAVASNNDKAKVEIFTDAVTAVIKPICNVEVRIFRSYNLFQWIAFGIICAYRAIKKPLSGA